MGAIMENRVTERFGSRGGKMVDDRGTEGSGFRGEVTKLK